ncbi:MAG: nucleoside deaminase [Bdellovibrionota bacterium]
MSQGSSTSHDSGVAYLQRAFDLAKMAMRRQEVPVGAVLVFEDGQIFESGNERERQKRVNHHCEALIIDRASQTRQQWRLEKSTLFVTLEPCLMCTGLIYASRIPRVVYGCDNPKGGALRFVQRHRKDLGLNHSVRIESGILEEEIQNLMKAFFEPLRHK